MSATAPVAGDLSRARANKLELIERLADDLAHEIKNPLHSMVINLEVLKRRAARAAGGDDADLLRYFDILAAELERVNRRVELLLRLARPGRAAEIGTLPGIVREMMELIELEARHRGVAILCEPLSPHTDVRVPAASARQAILNVVLAVLDAAGEGATLYVSFAAEEHAAVLALRVESPQPLPRMPQLGSARDFAQACGASLDVHRAAEGSGSASRIVLRIPASGS